MRFNPNSDDVWPAGQYRGVVVAGEDTVSGAGNEMMFLTLKLTNTHHGSKEQKDWLLEKMYKKLRRFCEYTGLKTEHESGDVAAYLTIGKPVMVDLIIEEERKFINKKGVEMTAARCNKVKDYLPYTEDEAQAEEKPSITDDDIPF